MPDGPRAAESLSRRLSAWARSEGRAFPWRGETDSFRILIAEMLLQRSRSSTVSVDPGPLTRCDDHQGHNRDDDGDGRRN